MWGPAEVTWLIAAVIGAWGMWGFLPHLWRPERRAAWWFSFVVVMLLFKAGSRSFYWDGLDIFVGEATADRWREGLGGTDVNWVFNVLAIMAGYGVLKLLHLLIPQEERRFYSPWTAPAYPTRLSLGLLILYMREIWRSRKR